MNLQPKEYKEPKVADAHETEAKKEPSLSEPSVDMPHGAEAPKSPAYFRVHNDMVKDMKIGKKVSIKGTVHSMTPSESHADHYDVQIGEPHVEHIDADGDDKNIAKSYESKENFATMPKEKLKAKIMRKDSSGY